MNEAIYDASFASCGPFYIPDSEGTNCPHNFMGIYDIMYQQYSPTSFCNDLCTIIVTTSDDGYLSSFAMNNFLRQEPYISCNDSFTINDGAFDLIKNNPPVQLVEQYVKCSTKPEDAIQNAIGIATGWVGLIVPLVVTFIVSIISFYYAQFVGELPQTDEDIKEADLNEKFNFLLDRYEAIKKESEEKILSLQKELIDAKKLTTLTQVDLLRLKQNQKDKDKPENSGEVLKTISFGLI